MQNIISLQDLVLTHPMLFVVLIAWSLVWKGFALWKAAKNNSPIWFVVLLIVNTFGLLEIIYILAIKRKPLNTLSTTTTQVKTETKVETVTESIKEVAPNTVAAEINHQEMKAGENNQETNQ